jgi:transcriptional regulator with XRE-family HTH domain
MSEATLGSRVRQLRQNAGLTQLQLSEKIYVSESYIALIEADKRNPSMDIVSRLADFFCVSSDYLIYGKVSDTERLLLKEWTDAVSGRSEKEIKNALELVRAFFACIDDNGNQS